MARGDITYRSSARLAHTAVWLFRAVAAVGVLYAAASLWRLGESDPLVASIASVPQGLLLSTAAVSLVALLAVAARLCAMVAFVAWLYRVTKNLPALGVSDPDVTPGWAIGCWFVPIVNIIAPCIVVLRVWRASDPGATAGRAGGARGWPLLFAWWGAFMVLTGAGLTVWLARAEGGLAAGLLTQGQVWAYLCSGIATIVVALLAVGVIREIERRQTEKAQLQAFT